MLTIWKLPTARLIYESDFPAEEVVNIMNGNIWKLNSHRFTFRYPEIQRTGGEYTTQFTTSFQTLEERWLPVQGLRYTITIRQQTNGTCIQVDAQMRLEEAFGSRFLRVAGVILLTLWVIQAWYDGSMSERWLSVLAIPLSVIVLQWYSGREGRRFTEMAQYGKADLLVLLVHSRSGMICREVASAVE